MLGLPCREDRWGSQKRKWWREGLYEVLVDGCMFMDCLNVIPIELIVVGVVIEMMFTPR